MLIATEQAATSVRKEIEPAALRPGTNHSSTAAVARLRWPRGMVDALQGIYFTTEGFRAQRAPR